MLGHSQADEQGLWIFQSPELAQGLHQFTVSEVDANGVESLPSQAFQVSVDQEVLTASELAVNGVPKAFVNGDQLSSGEHHFSGKAEANSTVEVFDKGEHIGTTSSDAEGNWTLSVNLKEGQHELSTTVKDNAGNISKSSEPVKLEVMDMSSPANTTGVTLPPGTSVVDGGYNNNELPELEAAQFTTSSTREVDESPLDFYSSEQIAQELEQLLIIQTDIDIHP